MALDMKRLEDGEDFTTEFKREYNDKAIKAITAFANTAGGTLYIGVNDDGTIGGVDRPDDVQLQVISGVRTGISPDVTLFVHFKVEKTPGAAVVVVTVRKGTARPYYLTGKGVRPEGVYVRQGASSVPASEAAILSMIKETSREKYEELESPNQNLTFKVTEEHFKKEKISFGPNQHKTLHLRTMDNVYTNLGLLLSDQSVHTVKTAIFEGPGKTVFKDRREFFGSLLSQLAQVYEFLNVHNRTYAEVQGLSRLERRDYPEEALREALLNALVHRDYSYSTSSQISIFDDRMEFLSIGGLPPGISLEDISLGLSMPRNKYLAEIFARLRLIESFGIGIPKIIQSYADCNRKPELETAPNVFKITLPNRNAQALKAGGGSVFLTENEEKITGLLDGRGEIARKDVETALSVSQAMAVRLLRDLVDKGALRVTGRGKNTRYRLPVGMEPRGKS